MQSNKFFESPNPLMTLAEKLIDQRAKPMLEAIDREYKNFKVFTKGNLITFYQQCTGYMMGAKQVISFQKARNEFIEEARTYNNFLSRNFNKSIENNILEEHLGILKKIWGNDGDYSAQIIQIETKINALTNEYTALAKTEITSKYQKEVLQELGIIQPEAKPESLSSIRRV